MTLNLDPDIFNPLKFRLDQTTKRFALSYGSAGSGKSFTQAQHEIIKCLQAQEKTLIIRKYGTTLKDSVVSLITTILDKWGLQSLYTHNKSDQHIRFINGSEMLFKGFDDPEKIKSIAGITRVWIEEATELAKDDFNQINLRVRGRDNLQITLTFNPIDEDHWINQLFFCTPEMRERCEILHTTYLDNKFIDEAYKAELESYRLIDPNYHKIYALGQWGGLTEGRIFQTWEEVDQFPEVDGYVYGLDFGYSCFSGDTLIRTNIGDKQIKDISKGDLVLTRNGYKKVINLFDNGYKKVIEKEITVNEEVINIIATFNHNFNVNNQWKKYGELTTKDKLCVLSNLTEMSTEDTQTVNIQDTIIASGKNKVSTILKCYTTLFIRLISEIFLMVKSYIILTLTLLIIILKILSLLLYQNILKFMGRLMILIGFMAKLIGMPMDIEKIIGIKGERSLLKALTVKSKIANIVKKITLQQIPIKDSVQINAPILYGCQITDIENISYSICRVYDIEVEDCHEYFANGILVHNCDPTAIVKVLRANDRIYVDEICYRTGLTNSDIAALLKDAGYRRELVICDSAEPKSIEELHRFGINAIGADKGKGSILAGIDTLRRAKVVITRRSSNLRKENKYYQWQQTKDGKFINTPKDFQNHLIDSLRYSLSLNLPEIGKKQSYVISY